MTGGPCLPVATINLPIAQESEAIVRSVYAAFSGLARSGEIASYVAGHFHLDCEYQPVEEASPVRGHVALIAWIERWLEAWEDAWDEIDEIVASGEVVVAAIRVHGRGRSSGLEISQRLFDVHELRDGRVLRITEYLESHQALGAAGLLHGHAPREWAGTDGVEMRARYCASDVAGERRGFQART
jgi:ketosteroid isomerase-like protein